MKDYRKLIIVVYVGVKSMNNAKAAEMLNQLKHMLDETFDNTIKTLIIPNRENDKIEIRELNKDKVPKEKIEDVISKVEKLTSDLNHE